MYFILNSDVIENEDGVKYRKFTVYDIRFCFGNDDFISGKLDNDFNFMRVLGGE